jgi:hypothetical protein
MSRRIMGYRAKLVMIAVAITAMVVGTNAATDRGVSATDRETITREQLMEEYALIDDPNGLRERLGLPAKTMGAVRTLAGCYALLSRTAEWRRTRPTQEVVELLRTLVWEVHGIKEGRRAAEEEGGRLYGFMGRKAEERRTRQLIIRLVRTSGCEPYDQGPAQPAREDPDAIATAYMGAEVGDESWDFLIAAARGRAATNCRESPTAHCLQIGELNTTVTDYVKEMPNGAWDFLIDIMRGAVPKFEREGGQLRAMAGGGDPTCWIEAPPRVEAILLECLNEGDRIDVAIANTVRRLQRECKEADESVYDEEAPALGWWSYCDVC